MSEQQKQKSPAPSFREYLLVWIKGVFMGAVELIPGVSAGTIALITGILPQLLLALKNINFTAIKLLGSGGLKATWSYMNGNFLLVLLFGMVSGFVLLMQVITFSLENYPVQIWSFFSGLIFASAIWLGKQIEKVFRFDTLLLFVIGILFAWYITVVSPIQIDLTKTNVFIAGMVAICAMVLPGLSGSFVLLLAGLYAPILQALKNLQWDIIILFMCGASIGILAFSHLLSYLFQRFPRQTYALLTGIMLGSLNKIWPWKEVLSYRVNSHGESIPFITQSISPAQFETINQSSAQLPSALICVFIGLMLVLVIDRLNLLLQKNLNE